MDGSFAQKPAFGNAVVRRTALAQSSLRFETENLARFNNQVSTIRVSLAARDSGCPSYRS